MERLFGLFTSLRDQLFAFFSRRMEANDLEEEELPVIIEDVLYKFHCPKRRKWPDVQIIFFHGMMCGDYKKAYAKTWKSVDGSLWPKTWLAEQFPNASILSISYDSSLVQSRNTGRLHLYQIAENLIQILKENVVGAKSEENCPIIMVGKDLGCLIIQAVCMKADEDDEEKGSQLLTNLKGFFFYSPFQLEIPGVFRGYDGKLVEDLKQQMSRSFGKFLKLKSKKRWTVKVLHAANSAPRGKRVIDIPEDYARLGSDEFYSISEDIDTITIPRSKTSQSFLYLRNFVSKCCNRLQCAPSGFSFSSDLCYIPLQTTEQQVLQALRDSKGASITLLYGESGSGKSALGRNVALHFQAEIDERLQPPACNIDGIMFEGVIHMECGPEVDLKTKQKELLQQLNPLVYTNKASENDTTKLLAGLLRERTLLIIMDDIWEKSFLQAMVKLSGKNVKWLILSQSRGICDGINSINGEGKNSINGHCTIGMETVNSKDARRILAALTGWPESWEDTSELQDAMTMLNDAMDSIISQTNANPLALTCIASNIDNEKYTDVNQWEEVAYDLSRALKTQPEARIHGKVYEQNYWKATELCFARLSDCQKYLLTVSCLCKGPSVPHSVIKYIFEQTASAKDRATFLHTMKELTGKQLVTVKTWEGYAAFGKVETLSVHDRWRKFITEEHLRPFQERFDDHIFIIEALEERHQCIFFKKRPQNTRHEGPAPKLQYDVLIRMAFLYFDQEFRPNLSDDVPTLQEIPSSTVDLRKVVIAPVVNLLVRLYGEGWTSLRTAALEVFFKYATDGIFEETHTSNLLKFPKSQMSMLDALTNSMVRAQHDRSIFGEQVIDALLELLATQTALHKDHCVHYCELLSGIAFAFAGFFQNGNLNQINLTDSRARRLQKVLDDLIPALLRLTEVNALCAGSLANLAYGNNIPDQMLSHTSLLTNLVVVMGKDDYHPAFQAQAAHVVNNLASSRETSTFMVGFPGLLPVLVAGLDNSENQELQTNSARALFSLACHGDGDRQLKLTNVNGLLQNLVTALGRDKAPALQAQAAHVIRILASNRTSSTIVDFPGVLPVLVAGLDNSENQELQTISAGAVASLACDGDGDIELKMTNVNGLLETLVTALQRDKAPALQAKAACAIWNLASNRTSSTMVGFPGLLPALVAGLDNSENQELQTNSVGALASLAAYGDSDLKTKITNFNGLLENLVTALGTDEAPTLQTQSARAIWNLASNRTSSTIVDFPRVLPVLVAGLDNSENQELQTNSVGALASLAAYGDSDLKTKITNFNGLLENLVTALGTDEAPTLQTQSARAIWNLASNRTSSTIVDFPRVLPVLVAGLDNSENQELQTNSVGALASLAAYGDSDLKTKITNFNGLLESLVTALGTDEAPALQAEAACAISNLASNRTSSTIVDFPRVLPVLVAGLDNSENQELQTNSVGALASLAAYGDSDLKTKITDFNGLLESLVTALGTDEAPALQAEAACAISNLASNRTSSTIVGFLGLLPALVAGFFNSENLEFQTKSVGALANLAGHGDGDIKLKMTNVNGLLENLMTALGMDEAPALQAEAARAICNLASNRTSSSMVGFPGLIPALVVGLDNSENQELRTKSAGALANLGNRGDDDLTLKMINVNRLLQNLVTALGTDEAPALQAEAARAIWNLASNRTSSTIVGFSGLLPTLVAGLDNSENLELQTKSVGALARLAGHGDGDIELKMTNVKGLLENLLTALGRDEAPALQAEAACAIRNLQSNRTSSIMVGFLGLIPALVAGLDNSENQELQKNSVGALANLAYGGDSDLKTKITNFNGLLENLVTALGTDEAPALQTQSARAIWGLASNRTSSTIVGYLGLLPALVAGLDNSENQEFQIYSAAALASLAGHGDGDIKLKMTNVKGLLENLVTALGTDETPALQAEAARAVYNMLSNRTRWMIVNSPGVLLAVVAGLENFKNSQIQIYSAETLAVLARGGDGVVRTMIDNSPKIVDVLVDEVAKRDSRDGRDDDTLKCEMFTLAVLNIERAREMQLGSTKALLGRAGGELWLGFYKESIEDFSRWEANLSGTLAEHPDASAALSMRCCAKAKLGDLQDALADADMVVNMNCTQFALQERGVVKRIMGNYSGALADIDASLRLEDDDYEVLKHRGFVKFLLKDEDGARADAERALTCKPSRVDDEDYGRTFLGGESLRYLDFELR